MNFFYGKSVSGLIKVEFSSQVMFALVDSVDDMYVIILAMQNETEIFLKGEDIVVLGSRPQVARDTCSALLETKLYHISLQSF